MGRIKTDLIKRVTRKLMEKYGDKFTEDFGKNKLLMAEVVELPSKKMRNTVAGYITRLVKAKNAPKVRRYRPEKDEDWDK